MALPRGFFRNGPNGRKELETENPPSRRFGLTALSLPPAEALLVPSCPP